MSALSPLAWGLVATVGVMVFAWLLSVPRKDVSIVDIFWGVNLLAAAIAYALALPGQGLREWLVLGMVAAWALRLSGFIAARNHGKPEDRRYQAMREKRGESFWWKSLYIVFLLQAAIAWVLSWQLYGAMAGTSPLNWLDAVGVALWLFGLVFEAVADRQLAQFLARPDRGDAVMDQGLWRYSRHPNYFGEVCVWWGLFLLAASAGAWWTVISTVMITFLILKVSGVSLTESDIAERRPAYRDYIERTSAFVPMPPKG